MLARSAGREIGSAAGSLGAALETYGFEPQADGPSAWMLKNCPFHRLARQHTELVCGLNLELLRGIADGAGDATSAMLLDPAPGRCCVRVVTKPGPTRVRKASAP
jgi:predicted ArsR family transcriptional regulator